MQEEAALKLHVVVRKEKTSKQKSLASFPAHPPALHAFRSLTPPLQGRNDGDLGSTYHVHQRIHHLSCHLNPWQCSASSTRRYYGARDLLEKTKRLYAKRDIDKTESSQHDLCWRKNHVFSKKIHCCNIKKHKTPMMLVWCQCTALQILFVYCW